jgi:hypothetical protein
MCRLIDERWEAAVIDRFMVVGLALACITLAALLYRRDQWPARDDSPRDTMVVVTRSPKLAASDAILDRKLPLVQFQETPVYQAILQLGDMAHANVLVRWDWIRYADVVPGNRITVKLRDVTLGQALSIVMTEAERGGTERLGFAVINQIIVISTYADFEPRPVTMAYNVRDIAARVVKDGPFPAVDRIVNAVKVFVAPESWRDNGGNIGPNNGKIQEFGGMLVITQTAGHQEQVARFLDKLRKPEGLAILNPPPATREAAP